MSLPRFYIPPNHWQHEALALIDEEAHHCAGVMRRSVGDEVVAFNGAGTAAHCRISAVTKSRVELACLATAQTPPPMVTISLLQAIPKAGNMELIIEKATELGAHEVIPVFTERTVVKMDGKDATKKREKWQRLALAACKQCGQNWLPFVSLPQPFDAVWSNLPMHDFRLIAAIQEDAQPLKALLREASAEPPTSCLIAIGPEGDFTAAEYALARTQCCRPMSLGPIILRVETAALFCLSVLAHELRSARDEAPAV
ncbi:MAG: RsmE family RNA methyltransferase [Roseimicrobium sp.]